MTTQTYLLFRRWLLSRLARLSPVIGLTQLTVILCPLCLHISTLRTPGCWGLLTSRASCRWGEETNKLNMYNHVVTLPHRFRVCAAYMAVQLEQPVLYTAAGSTQPRQLGELQEVCTWRIRGTISPAQKQTYNVTMVQTRNALLYKHNTHPSVLTYRDLHFVAVR